MEGLPSTTLQDDCVHHGFMFVGNIGYPGINSINECLHVVDSEGQLISAYRGTVQ